jgi:HPr kinase/phosphorylase
MITVETLFKDARERLQLTLITEHGDLSRKIVEADIHRPGLALAGFVELFTYHRVQVLGNTEIYYMRKLSPAKLQTSLEKFFSFDIPCVIITNKNDLPKNLTELANQRKICVFSSPLATTKFGHLLGEYLDEKFAPSSNVHGSLVDVYGVGLLFTGRSGIGKSEIALDLVERGHRLVADDVVNITHRAEGILIGTGRGDPIEHYIEIRGVGIIDIKRMFGIRAIRMQKRIEVEVQLVEWHENLDVDRLGVEEKVKEILDVKIPFVELPINPGKNITVIAEVIALNQLLKLDGYDAAREFSQKLLKKMMEKVKIREYLAHDFE